MIKIFNVLEGQASFSLPRGPWKKRYHCLVCGEEMSLPWDLYKLPQADYMRAYCPEHRQQMKEKFVRMGAFPD